MSNFSWLFKILVDFEVAELTLFSSFSAINFKRLGLGARMWSWKFHTSSKLC